jgi:hypothetical protein
VSPVTTVVGLATEPRALKNPSLAPDVSEENCIDAIPRGDVEIVEATENIGPDGGVVEPNPIAIGSVDKTLVPLSETAESPIVVELAAFGIVFVVRPEILAGVPHVPSPLQNVEADALVPEFRLVTGRLPVTPLDKSTCAQAGLLLVPVLDK